VKLVKGRKKRHRDRKLAAGWRGEPKEVTWGDCGSGQKLATACRKVSRRALFRKVVDHARSWLPV
jgi:hypothetical protein